MPPSPAAQATDSAIDVLGFMANAFPDLSSQRRGRLLAPPLRIPDIASRRRAPQIDPVLLAGCPARPKPELNMTESSSRERYRANLQGEVDSAALYRTL